MVALLAEGVDRNTGIIGPNGIDVASPSSRRAWIEIPPQWPVFLGHTVALLAEGVDRNFWMGVKPSSRLVVLLAEGVDRNEKYNMELYNGKVSPSSRRAWIEIAPLLNQK